MIVIGSASVSAAGKAATNEFKLGDYVWVSGVKKGIIAFIGETQFAPGVWAGVQLDEPIGKNDGSVTGVRYFACRPQHGIFAKLNALTSRPSDSSDDVASKEQEVADVSKSSDAISDGAGSSVSASAHNGQCKELDQANDKDSVPAANVSRSSKLPGASSRPSGLARFSKSSGTVSSSSSSLSQTAATAPPSQSAASASLATANTAPHTLKIGDRVVIGGNKEGTLRYFGATHFAKGEWAGIELNEPIGKNDGSVEGKR